MTSPTKQPVHTDSIHTNAIHSDFIHSELLHAKAKQRRLHLWLSIGLLCSTLLLVGLIVLSNATTIDVFPKKAKDSASINIVNSIAFSIDNVIYSLQNNPTIEIHATGFQALRKTLLDHETGHTLRIELTEQTQSLQITTTPQTDQTRWFMDNTLVNIAAAFKQQLLSGQYHIGIDNPYYQTKNISIDMKLGQALQRHVQLENISGSLTIHSQPRADIQINGQPIELTPITLQRTGGLYHLKITHADYQTITEDVEITNSKLNITRDYRLLPKPAFLHISLSPGGGVLLLNGKAVNGKDLNRKTKLPIKLAIPALRDNTLSYFKPGYFSQQKHINIPSGSEQHIAFHLKAKTGIVYIRSKPTRDTAPATMRNSAGIMLKRFNPNTSFVMGAPRYEQGQRANEFLRHIRLNKAFYISTHEISNAQYAIFRNKRNNKGNSLAFSLNDPVTNISWFEAVKFCNWLSQQEKLKPFYNIQHARVTSFNSMANGYRLPTEAEWEWLARKAGKNKQSKFSWGDATTIPAKAGNIADEYAKGSTSHYVPNYSDAYAGVAPVGSYPDEKSGLFDITGNVSEWVHDVYSLTPPNSQTIETNPLGAMAGDTHTIKGSSWRSGTITELRASYRDGATTGRDDIGFRIARSSPNNS